MKYKILTLFLLPFLMGAGCQKDEEILEELEFVPIVIQKFADFGCEHQSWKIKAGYANDYYIINSAEDLNKYIEYECKPDIDFSKYIVILGNKGFSTGTSLVSEKVEENNVELVYTLTFSKGFSMDAPSVKYHIVIPIPYNKDIKLVEVVEQKEVN